MANTADPTFGITNPQGSSTREGVIFGGSFTGSKSRGIIAEAVGDLAGIAIGAGALRSTSGDIVTLRDKLQRGIETGGMSKSEANARLRAGIKKTRGGFRGIASGQDLDRYISREFSSAGGGGGGFFGVDPDVEASPEEKASLQSREESELQRLRKKTSFFEKKGEQAALEDIARRDELVRNRIYVREKSLERESDELAFNEANTQGAIDKAALFKVKTKYAEDVNKFHIDTGVSLGQASKIMMRNSKLTQNIKRAELMQAQGEKNISVNSRGLVSKAALEAQDLMNTYLTQLRSGPMSADDLRNSLLDIELARSSFKKEVATHLQTGKIDSKRSKEILLTAKTNYDSIKSFLQEPANTSQGSL